MKPPLPLLRHPADGRTLLLLGLLSICLLLGWLTGFLLLLGPGTILCLTACSAKHNHIHCRTFHPRPANRLFDFWLAILTGSTTTGIRIGHQVRHHGQNQSPEDFVRTSQVRSLPPLRALLQFVPRVLAASWPQNSQDLSPEHRHPLRRARRQEAFVLWAVILAGLIADPLRFLLFPSLPWLFSQWFLIAVNLPQHDGCDPASALGHSRNSTGPITNWLLLNNGYHTAHHLSPGCHWSQLPAWHANSLTSAIPPELNCPSFASFWISWWRSRKQQFPT